MSQPSGDGIMESVERLVEKMERMYNWQAAENEKMERMVKSLESLSKVVSRMESERSFENDLNKRIDNLTENIQKVVTTQVSLAKEGDKTIDRVVKGVKLFGQILSAVATGVQFSVESVGTVLKKDTEENITPGGKAGITVPQVDLSAILEPIGNLVKNLASEKMKLQEEAIKKESTSVEETGRK
ncbi:MAG: hypothetical protein ACYDEQ_07415 [Desulfocucumaceae bacterium]